MAAEDFLQRAQRSVGINRSKRGRPTTRDECDNDRKLERGAQDQIIAVCAPLVAKTNREICKQHDGNQRREEEPEPGTRYQ